MKMLEHKRMLVTGGSRGIGAEVVRTAMQEGADVAFIYRHSAEAAELLSQEMATLYPGQRCLAFPGDVADIDGMRPVIQNILQAFQRIDVLVNNAGLTRDATLARMRRQQWDEVIATNLGSMFNTIQPLLLPMVKQRAGSIINVTSATAIYGSSGQTNYAASKGGIIGFTKALSAEVAPFGVRVNAVAPGYIETDMMAGVSQERIEYVKSRVSRRRLGTPADVAPLICFLGSDQADYITGQVIQVDGGITF